MIGERCAIDGNMKGEPRRRRNVAEGERATAERLEKKASKIRTEWEGHTLDQVDKQVRKELVDRDEAEQYRLKIAEDQFRLGYAAGVTEVLRGAGPRGAYRSLRLRFPTR